MTDETKLTDGLKRVVDEEHGNVVYFGVDHNNTVTSVDAVPLDDVNESEQ